MSWIPYLFFAAPYLIALGFAFFLVGLVVGAAQTPWVVLVLLGVAMVAEAASIYPLALNFGVWVYPGDFFAIIALGALFYRLVFLHLWGSVHWAWWVLGAVQFGLFIWGIGQHGTGAGVDYRAHFSAWVGAAYLATFMQDDRHVKRILLAIQVLALGLVMVAVYRWVGSALDPRMGREIDYFVTTGVAYRVIWAAPTLMVGMAMLVSLFHATRSRQQSLQWMLAIAFGLVVLVLQHRSVWVAGMGGIFVLAVLLSRVQAGNSVKFLGASIAFLLLAVLVVGSFSGVTASIGLQTERALSAGGTFLGGRVASWDALLKEWLGSGSPLTYLVGKPFGGGYERYAGETLQRAVEYQPHNYYIHLLYRGGGIGLAAFLYVMYLSLKSLLKQAASGSTYAPVLLALQFALLLFYIPYGVSYDQALVLSLLLGAASMGRLRLPGGASLASSPAVALRRVHKQVELDG